MHNWTLETHEAARSILGLLSLKSVRRHLRLFSRLAHLSPA